MPSSAIPFRHRMKQWRTKSLQVVRQRIHASRRSQHRRQTDGQFRVQYHAIRAHVGMKHDDLAALVPLDNDRGAAYFRASTGGSGNGHDRNNPVGVRPHPVISRVFQVPQTAFLQGNDRNGLTSVQSAAAAQSNHAVMIPVLVYGYASGDILPARIGFDITENPDSQSGVTASINDFPHHRQHGDTRIGDHKRRSHIVCFADCCDFINPPGARLVWRWDSSSSYSYS